jgi:hypothetical protein
MRKTKTGLGIRWVGIDCAPNTANGNSMATKKASEAARTLAKLGAVKGGSSRSPAKIAAVRATIERVNERRRAEREARSAQELSKGG